MTDSTLPKWHEFSINEEPNVSKAIGKKAKMERMKAGEFRFHIVTDVSCLLV